MGHIYFVRHGQSMWNVAWKVCGATDIPLTEKGHEQAKAIGRKICEERIKFDEILCSPLLRAYDTAQHISEAVGVPFRVEERLKEQNFGKYEGVTGKSEEFQAAKRHFIDSYEGGESMLKLAQRVYNLLDDLKKEADNKTYLLVAHNGIARVVCSYFQDMTNEEYAGYGIDNCEIKRFDFKQ